MKKTLSTIMASFIILCSLAACSTNSPTQSSEIQQENSQITASEEASETSPAETYVIRVGLPEALENPIGVMSTQIKEQVEAESSGRLKLELYPSNQLGGPREMLEAVGFGNLEMTICTPTDLTSFVPEMGVLTFPYLFNDSETAYKILDGEIGQELSSAAEKAGFKILGYPDIGFRHITNSLRPITCLEDFKGIKIRTRGVPAHLATFQAFGANPVSVSFSELYAALDQKVVDGQENSATNIYFNNFFEVQDYLSVTNTFYEAWSITINKDYFNALPQDLQAILQKAIDDGVAQNRLDTTRENDEYLEKLKDLMEVNEIDPAEMDRIIQTARDLYPEFAKDVGEDLVNRVLEAVG